MAHSLFFFILVTVSEYLLIQAENKFQSASYSKNIRGLPRITETRFLQFEWHMPYTSHRFRFLIALVCHVCQFPALPSGRCERLAVYFLLIIASRRNAILYYQPKWRPSRINASWLSDAKTKDYHPVTSEESCASSSSIKTSLSRIIQEVVFLNLHV